MSVNLSSNSSFLHLMIGGDCVSMFTVIFCLSILFLPACTYVLFLGCQRCRRHRSGAAAERMSHADVFTLNMVVLEIITMSGTCLYIYGIRTRHLWALNIGMHLWSMVSPGQTVLLILTCVDFYLAVVHPVVYLSLRGPGVVRVRNVVLVFLWLFCFAYPYIVRMVPFPGVVNLLFILTASCIVCFCCCSILCSLTRPGPGRPAGTRQQVDQSKRRAFHTILLITAALMLRLSCVSMLLLLEVVAVDEALMCVCGLLSAMLMIPSSWVLPLLFLQRAGKLPTCKQAKGPGQCF